MYNHQLHQSQQQQNQPTGNIYLRMLLNTQKDLKQLHRLQRLNLQGEEAQGQDRRLEGQKPPLSVTPTKNLLPSQSKLLVLTLALEKTRRQLQAFSCASNLSRFKTPFL